MATAKTGGCFKVVWLRKHWLFRSERLSLAKRKNLNPADAFLIQAKLFRSSRRQWLLVNKLKDPQTTEIDVEATRCLANLDDKLNQDNVQAIKHLTAVSVAMKRWGGSGKIYTKEEWEAENRTTLDLATFLRACRARHTQLDKQRSRSIYFHNMNRTNNSALSLRNQASMSLEDFRQDVTDRINRQRGMPTEPESQMKTTHISAKEKEFTFEEFKMQVASKNQGIANMLKEGVLPVAKEFFDLHDAPGRSTPPVTKSVTGNLSHGRPEVDVKKEPVAAGVNPRNKKGSPVHSLDEENGSYAGSSEADESPTTSLPAVCYTELRCRSQAELVDIWSKRGVFDIGNNQRKASRTHITVVGIWEDP
ncbi:hypothetical protein B0H11DRAFT_1904158 [Mycena galericulata]|nr:hypothetical protein B0H11DRAFT_1904158 [Mycena galericulata]